MDAALGTVGLASVADRRVGGFSLGMGQRLVLHELAPRLSSLEDVYTAMTSDSVEFRGDTDDR